MSEATEVVAGPEMLASYPLGTIVAEYRDDLVMSVMFKTEHSVRGQVWEVTSLPSPISNEDAWGFASGETPDTVLLVLAKGRPA